MAVTDNINSVVEAYFAGLFRADVELLKSIFDEKACLQAPNIRRTRDEWLALVASRAVPEQNGETWQFAILDSYQSGPQAVVKVRCPILGFDYIDYLSLLCENGHWQIVNKLYAEKES